MLPVTRDSKNRVTKIGTLRCVPPHIKSVAIPPAWITVLADPDPKARLWVTGIDSKGRRQPIYNPEFRAAQDADKFAKTHKLIDQYDVIRDQITREMSRREVALVAYLILETAIRPGSEADTGGDVPAYGATTLRARHITDAEDGTILLKFVGKKGVSIEVPVRDERLAHELLTRSVQRGGSNSDRFLFAIDEKDLRHYVATLGDGSIKPKDFRTMKGTHLAMRYLDGKQIPETKREKQKLMKEVCVHVAAALGNTPAVAKKSYICPSVWAAFTN